MGGIALAASLVGCHTQKFNNSDWRAVPYTGEIWTSYMGEDIERSPENWKLYCNMVAHKNHAKCEERNGMLYLVGFSADTILIPNLDGSRDGVKIRASPNTTKEVQENQSRVMVDSPEAPK